MVGILRVAAILAIILGFILRNEGYPNGDTVIKFGMALLIVLIIMGFFRISKNSRGSYR